MRTIDQVLDRAKQVQNVGSDYKLGLCLGIGGTSLSSYRTGRSLPDEKACSILAAAIGESPGLLLVEIQAQRAKTTEAKAMWSDLAKRLQTGFANVQMLFAIAMFCIASLVVPAMFAVYLTSFSASSLYIMLSSWLRSHRAFMLRNVKLCKVTFQLRKMLFFVSVGKG